VPTSEPTGGAACGRPAEEMGGIGGSLVNGATRGGDGGATVGVCVPAVIVGELPLYKAL